MMFLLLNDRKNMFMWSSLVFEIWGPKKYIFFIIGFQTSGSKTTTAWGLKFSVSSTSGITLSL